MTFVFPKTALSQQLPDSILFSEDGLGVTTNAVGDYSAGLEYWELRPGPTEVFRVHSIIVTIKDKQVRDVSKYGALAALTNGITFQLVDGVGGAAVILSTFTAGESIKSNGDWVGFSWKMDVYAGGNPGVVMFGRGVADFFGDGIQLDGSADIALRMVLNDDFTGLTSHHFLGNGYYENATIT